ADRSVAVPHGAYLRPVVVAGQTVYTNDRGETATGAVPLDAVRGFTPAPRGMSYGPDMPLRDCHQPPPQAKVDHATLSDAEWLRYGLRTHTDIPDRAEWTTMVRALDHRSCAFKTIYRDGHTDRHGQADGGPCQQHQDWWLECPANWSGWSADRYHDSQ